VYNLCPPTVSSSTAIFFVSCFLKPGVLKETLKKESVFDVIFGVSSMTTRKEWGRSIQLKDWGYIFLLNLFWKLVLPKSTTAKARPLCLTVKPEQAALRNVVLRIFPYRFRKPRLFVSSVSCHCYVTQNHSSGWCFSFSLYSLCDTKGCSVILR
jgi:hypothetical protein